MALIKDELIIKDFSGAHIGDCFSTLEKMLLFWKNESNFIGKCDCGGKAVVYHFNISNLSGCSAYKICIKCRKLYKEPYDFKDTFSVLQKYKQEESIIGDPVAIVELVNYLKDENYEISTHTKDDYSNVPIYLTYSVWKEKI